MPKRKSLGQEMYSGTAEFGRIMAIIGAVVATLIGIGLIIFGGILTTHKTQFSASVQGTVIDSSMCVPTNNDDGSITETCMVAAHYNVGSQCKPCMIAGTVTSSVPYTSGFITVYYDPSDPKQASLNSDDSTVGGWVMIAIGIVMIIFSWLWVWITRKYKIAAAVGGVTSGLDILSGGRL